VLKVPAAAICAKRTRACIKANCPGVVELEAGNAFAGSGMGRFGEWSDTKIVITGFGTGYGENCWAVLKGELVIIAVELGISNDPANAPQTAIARFLP
jgi:hypothetical protein